MEKSEFYGAVKRAATLSGDDKLLYLQIAEGGITLRSGATGLGTAEEGVTAEVTGTATDVILYAPHLLSSIPVVDAERVVMEFNTATQPVQFRPCDNEDFRTVIQIKKGVKPPASK
jgi:DNA polymerase III sliding clamp (beta) subunit (PCNA family)